MIDSFKKENSFLSNMAFYSYVTFDNITYPTVEHFYVAMKVEKKSKNFI